MAKVKLTAEDMQKGLPSPNGWFKGLVVDAFAKPSKDKQSINYIATLQYESNPELKIEARFNSKALGFMKPYLAACAGQTMEEFMKEHPDGVEFDWENTKGSKLQFEVKDKIFENRPVSEVVSYAFYDYKVPF